MLVFIVFLILLVIILPALVIIPQSFTTLNYFTFPIPEYCTKWYEKFMENSEWIIGLQRSLIIAIISAVVATIIGTMAAVAFEKLEFKGKSVFMSFMIAPMVVPVIITGVALYTTFSKIGLTNTIPGIIIAHTLLAIPMVFITMMSGLSNVNENLELAAMSMGAGPIRTFFEVVLPTVKSSLTASILFAFVTSLDEVVVTIFVSGANTKTLTMVMWENLRTTINPTLAVAATFLVIITLGMYILKEVLEVRSKNKIS